LAVLTTEALTGADFVAEGMKTGITEGEGSGVDCQHRRLLVRVDRPVGLNSMGGPRTLSSLTMLPAT